MTNWYRVYNELILHYNKEYQTTNPPSLKEVLEYLYTEQHLSLVEIATLTNREVMSANTLRDHFAKLGISIRSRGGANCTKELILTANDFECYSAAELARKHNVDIGTIYRRKHILLKEPTPS